MQTAHVAQQKKKKNQKMGRKSKWTFLRRCTDGQKYTQRCSTSLIVREIQIKTTMRYHLTLVRIANIKNLLKKKILERVWRRENTPIPLVRKEMDTTTIESNMGTP